ncbi:TPA: hypothetical protein ACF7XJ_004746 [Klebsiella pneumoniae]
MTDITELAQRARINAECGEHLSPAETLELVEALESEKRICSTWRKTAESTGEKLQKAEKTSEARREAIDRTHNMFVRERDRANAAEEALEKAHQRIDELENDEVRQRLANAEHQLYMAELAKNNLRASRKAQFRKRKAAEQRIAELESRTVKLPAERFCPAEYAGSQLWSETEVWNKAITACADALRADGIKVEAE